LVKIIIITANTSLYNTHIGGKEQSKQKYEQRQKQNTKKTSHVSSKYIEIAMTHRDLKCVEYKNNFNENGPVGINIGHTQWHATQQLDFEFLKGASDCTCTSNSIYFSGQMMINHIRW
jgi:hypothetical protein